MSRKLWAGGTLLLLLLGVACEEPFTPPRTDEPAQLVVEGYIEAGDQPTPPYIFLTRSLPFFSKIDSNELADLFVHDATITVSDGEQTVQLTELCLQSLSPEQRALAAELLGVAVDSFAFNFCAYLDLSLQMLGREGRTYDLRIEAEGQTLTARTFLPPRVPLDSLWFVAPPGEPIDSLAQLQVILDDPRGPNFYRYFTGVNGGPLRRPPNSVFDDNFFDGQRFRFPLAEAEADSADFNLSTYGYFERGDTATIKWMAIDEAAFNFWSTLEFARTNQGPFSSYTRIDHNIEGGLGIWMGLAASYYTRRVPDR